MATEGHPTGTCGGGAGARHGRRAAAGCAGRRDRAAADAGLRLYLLGAPGRQTAAGWWASQPTEY